MVHLIKIVPRKAIMANSARMLVPNRICHQDRPGMCILDSPVRSPIDGSLLIVPDTQDPDDAIYLQAERLGRLDELPWAKNYEPTGDRLPKWAKAAPVTGLEDEDLS